LAVLRALPYTTHRRAVFLLEEASMLPIGHLPRYGLCKEEHALQQWTDLPYVARWWLPYRDLYPSHRKKRCRSRSGLDQAENSWLFVSSSGVALPLVDVSLNDTHLSHGKSAW